MLCHSSGSDVSGDDHYLLKESVPAHLYSATIGAGWVLLRNGIVICTSHFHHFLFRRKTLDVHSDFPLHFIRCCRCVKSHDQGTPVGVCVFFSDFSSRLEMGYLLRSSRGGRSYHVEQFVAYSTTYYRIFLHQSPHGGTKTQRHRAIAPPARHESKPRNT